MLEVVGLKSFRPTGSRATLVHQVYDSSVETPQGGAIGTYRANSGGGLLVIWPWARPEPPKGPGPAKERQIHYPRATVQENDTEHGRDPRTATGVRIPFEAARENGDVPLTAVAESGAYGPEGGEEVLPPRHEDARDDLGVDSGTKTPQHDSSVSAEATWRSPCHSLTGDGRCISRLPRTPVDPS